MATPQKTEKSFSTSAPEKGSPKQSATPADDTQGSDRTAVNVTRRKGERLCKVHRRGENQKAPITCTPGDIKRKKEFWPGQSVYLTDQHINVLRAACIDSEIPIPDNSGIYDAPNPVFEAQKQNPGYEAKVDISTGSVYLKKTEPLYIVEVLE